MFRQKTTGAALTAAEAAAASIAAFLCFSIVFAYFEDWIGFTIVPVPTLVLAAGGTVGLWLWLGAGLRASRPAIALLAVVAGFAGTLLWASWPDLLPPGGGADLTHHLQLVDYLDRHRRLIHDPGVEAYLGEMVHYTPGVHLLASLAGQWSGRDGFQAVYPVVALSVAIKAGLVLLISLRVLRNGPFRMPFAIVSVALLLLPRAFFIGSFGRYSYLAQVVSEMFAVVTWWAAVIWDQQPSYRAAALFAIGGVGVFLTWPVWIGPPLIVLFILLLTRGELPPGTRLRMLLVAALPIVVVAAIHAGGRLGWAGIVRTDADMTPPSLRDFNVLFVVLSTVGLAALTTVRQGRATALLVAACALQAAVLFLLAKANGARVPYMAIKMGYLIIYPLAVGAALALAIAWEWLARSVRRPSVSTSLAWLAAIAAIAVSVGSMATGTRQPRTVTRDLYDAGEWARANLDPACVDYIVANDNTAYWLHLAVLGNRRMSPRTADDSTFRTKDAIVRWINPGGLPFAVTDLGTIPKDVLAETDELARFGTAVVIKRRGPSACAEQAH